MLHFSFHFIRFSEHWRLIRINGSVRLCICSSYEEEDVNLIEAKQSWHGGHYENFEIRYTREPDYTPPSPRYRMSRVRLMSSL